MLTVAQAAYLAGILDGEGCFSLRKSKNSAYHVYISEVAVGTTTPDLTDWLHAVIPGSIIHASTPPGNREASCTWRVSTKEGLTWMLPQVIEYLVIKKLHAQLLLKYCMQFADQIPGVTLTPEEVELKNAYCVMFANLNARGVGSLASKKRVISLFSEGSVELPSSPAASSL